MAPLVRHGADEILAKAHGGHSSMRVHAEMVLQICRDYPGLPDVRTLRSSEIRFFYDGLRPELKRQSAPKGR